MFKGANIPAVLNIPGVLDRTLWVFRNRYFPYMMINLACFGLPFLVSVYLVSSGIVNLDFNPFVEFFYFSKTVMYALLLFTFPSLLSDIAMQYYTSFLIREKEIKWWEAIRKAVSVKSVHLFLAKIFGGLMMLVVAGIGFVTVLIPLVGSLIYYYLIISVNALVVGMAPAIIVEENKGAGSAIGRNIELGRASFGVFANSSVAAFFTYGGFVMSSLVFLVLVGSLIAAVFLNTTDILMLQGDRGEIVAGILIMMAPIAGALLYMPLQSIFFSMLYYNTRARSEGFHLENRIDVYQKQLKAEKASAEEARAAELVKIRI